MLSLYSSPRCGGLTSLVVAVGALLCASAFASVDIKNINGVRGTVTEVTSLPGWDGPLPSKIYSGFTDSGSPPNNASGSMFTHWVLVESEGNPETDPLVVWYQGGPGASSLFGLFVEFGPFMLNELSMPAYHKTGIPELIRNEWSWSKLANVLVVDNPPPTGFSYCEPVGPTGGGYSCGNWNDSTTSAAQHIVLTNWIKQMPKYASLDMYITGESYAGIYVPTIVERILADPRGVNLKGFAVGDGCMGTEVLCGPGSGPYWDVEFMHGHGQFSNKLYNKIMTTCTVEALKTNTMSPACNALLKDMNSEIGGYYSYNLYDTCFSQHIFDLTQERKSWTRASFGGALNDYACAGPAQGIWVNLTEARNALGVPVDANFFSGDNAVGMNYTLTEPNVLPFYASLVSENKLKVLVYNGDTDPGINSFITQDKYVEYFDAQNLTETEVWRPWTFDGKDQMGGYVFGYGSNFNFLTIRGSGHMVPEFKPQAAYVMLEYFLSGKPWPQYTKQ
eukprot:m.112598 g.112598  ORF g.112598 m.112598 type:complete len:505 (-) comp9256_c9_seq1:1971-3485(-)